MAKIDLTAERLNELFHYSVETGIFTRKIKSARNVEIGSVAGAVDSTGYVRGWVDNRQYLMHRLAWLYVHGEWPAHTIDHIDGDKTNNRITNLRDVGHAINMQNIRTMVKDNSSGFVGVSKVNGRRGKDAWTAHIRAFGKFTHLGTFTSLELARSAYIDAKRLLHTGCTI